MPASLKARTLLLWLFPLAVWLVATGFYGFQLGKYSDDWSQSLINPQTGSADANFHPWVRWPFFFRPLYFVVVWAINTPFWECDWARHLIAALAHLGVGVCLYRLLRRIGLSGPISIVPVAVFLSCPTHHEAVLWVASVGIPIGTALFLIAATRVVDFARQIPDQRPWGRLAGIAALIFAAACFHEQPAAAAAALPALYLACSIPNQPTLIRLRRAMLVGVSGGAACMLYTALITLSAPAGRRGSLSSLVSGADAPQRLANFSTDIGRWLFGDHARDAVFAAADRGAHIVGAQPTAIFFGALVVAGLAGWLVAFVREGPSARGHWTTRRLPWLLMFAVVASVISLVPVAMTASTGIYSRYFYVLTLGLPLLAAFALDSLSGLRASRRLRSCFSVAVALLAAGASAFGALAMVSWQSDFAARAAMDRDIGSQLVRLVPSPPPGAVVIPISCAIPGIVSERARHAIPGVLERPFAGWAFVQHLYGRSDISATHCRAGDPAPIRLCDDPPGLAYVHPGGWPIEVRDQWGRGIKKRSTIPWSEAIPIEIDADGRVRLLLRVEVEQRLANRR